MELKHYSLQDLKRLSTKIQVEIGRRNAGAKRDLLKRIEKMVAEHGLSLSEIVVGNRPETPKAKKPAAQKPKLPPKYWNPLNPKEGWSGHARRPGWVQNWLANGGKLEELAVKRT